MRMPYIDGFVVPVPKDKLPAYKKLAKRAAKVWREYGALEYVECSGDDTPYGKRTSFPRSVKAKEGEIVVFAWIVYKSRKERDRINKQVMSDPRLKDMTDVKSLPFDAK